MAKQETRYRREVLLQDKRFASVQRDFLAAVLHQPTYTIAEAEKAVRAFFYLKEGK